MSTTVILSGIMLLLTQPLVPTKKVNFEACLSHTGYLNRASQFRTIIWWEVGIIHQEKSSKSRWSKPPQSGIEETETHSN